MIGFWYARNGSAEVFVAGALVDKGWGESEGNFEISSPRFSKFK